MRMATYNSERDSRIKVRRAPPIVRRDEGTLHPDVQKTRTPMKQIARARMKSAPISSATRGPIASEAAPKKKRKKPRLEMSGGAVRARLDRRARGGKVQDHDPKHLGDDQTLEREANREQREQRYAEDEVDRRACGGRIKPHTHVNVMIAPQHPGTQPVPVPVGAPPAAPMAAPARPPMAMAPGAAPMMAPGAMPIMQAPGTPPPIRQFGGRVMRASGGRIKDGPGWTESLKNMTPISHTPGKAVELERLRRGKKGNA
jgi:hypothetical protein